MLNTTYLRKEFKSQRDRKNRSDIILVSIIFLLSGIGLGTIIHWACVLIVMIGK